MKYLILVLLVVLAFSITPTPQKIIEGSTHHDQQISQFFFEFFHQENTSPVKQTSHFRQIITELTESKLIETSKNGIKPCIFINLGNAIAKVSVFLKELDFPQDYQDLEKTDESYEIYIDFPHIITFKCHGYVSFIRAISTFSQLLKNGYFVHKLPLHIQDQPSYKYRGIMVDPARHFQPLETIYKQIRAMMIVKLNVLHLHLTDNESFPIDIPSIPELSQYGAYSKDQHYTPTDISNIILYAQQRGVLVIPEIDTPAHVMCWSNSEKYHDMSACHGYPANREPQGQLDPTIDFTYETIEKVFSDIQSMFHANYFHLGGDEVYSGCYNLKPSIKQFMDKEGIKDYNQLQNYYMNKIAPYVQQDKNKIFWFNSQQIGLKYPNNSIIQFWGNSSEYDQIKQFDNQIILSTYDYLYLTCGMGNFYGDNSWCNYQTWKKVYEFNPVIPGISQDRVLGGEAAFWSELTPYTEMDNTIWPRTTSFAMRIWNVNEKLGVNGVAHNLYDVNQLLIKAGLTPGALSSEYCELNIDKCFYNV